jgi:hypothetical protein
MTEANANVRLSNSGEFIRQMKAASVLKATATTTSTHREIVRQFIFVAPEVYPLSSPIFGAQYP